jgi:hypothetical protein
MKLFLQNPTRRYTIFKMAKEAQRSLRIINAEHKKQGA